MDDETPSTKHLVLKPKEVIPIDAVARPGDGSAISVQLIHSQNRLAEEKASKRKKVSLPQIESAEVRPPPLSPIFKPKEIELTDQPARPGDEEAISVPDILLENRIAEMESGWGRIRHKRRRLISRRTRDFFIIVGLGDLAVMGLVRWCLNAVSMVYGIAAVTLLSSTLAWIMFVVMDDY
jgi:hypothetical protein